MFENIIGQAAVVATLRRELAEGSLPRAILLHGPGYSGKLSTALEVARALTCDQGSGEWTCTCRACAAQKLLVHPYTLLLGPRYFELEIAASADALRRTRKPAGPLPVHPRRAQAHPALRPAAVGGGGGQDQGARPPRRRDGGAAGDARPRPRTAGGGRAGEGAGAGGRGLPEARRGAGRGQHPHPADPPGDLLDAPVRRHPPQGGGAGERGPHVRRLPQLPAQGAGGAAGGRPPSSCWRPTAGALLPTVRSRLRAYELAERGPEEVRTVLRKIFHDESEEYGSLSDYFLFRREPNPEILLALARRFVGLAAAGRGRRRTDILEEMAPLLSTRSDRNSVSYFLETLLRVLHSRLRGGKGGPPPGGGLVRDHPQPARRSSPLQPEPQPGAGVLVLPAQRGSA